MRSKFPFDLPAIPHSDLKPIWQGDSFLVGKESLPVLPYSSDLSGWNDKLTENCELLVGKDHPFENASRIHALGEIKQFAPKAQSILEIGCSSGYLLAELKQQFPDSWVMGADVINDSLQRLAKRLPETPLFQFDLTQCPLPDACIDVVILLNVLEHIKEDKIALQQIHRILKPGGLLVLEVPAGPELYDQFDRYCRHYRRYRSKELAQLLIQTGFSIKKQSHLGFLIYPAYYLIKLKERFSKKTLSPQELFAKQMSMSQKNPLFNFLMKIELALGKKFSFPFGIRCLYSCEK